MVQKNHKKSLRLEIMEKLTTLVVSGFGLVAALAWNDAIKLLFTKIFPKPDGKLIASFLYALLITAIVVFITVKLSNLTSDLKRKIASKSNNKNNNQKV